MLSDSSADMSEICDELELALRHERDAKESGNTREYRLAHTKSAALLEKLKLMIERLPYREWRKPPTDT